MKTIGLFLFILFYNVQLLQAEENKGAIVLIFCDITPSIDTVGIIDVATIAQKLYANFPRGTRLNYYSIDIVQNTPFLEYYKPKFANNIIPSTRTEEIRDKQIKINQLKTEKKDDSINQNKIYNTIIDLHNKYRQNLQEKNPPLRSCIVRTFSLAQSVFNEYRQKGEYYTYEIIYLSDMIEQCEDINKGGINMCSGNLTGRNLKLIRERIDKYKFDFNLDYATITIIIPNQNSEKVKLISSQTLDLRKELWAKIFSKVGFSNQQIKNFYFAPGIPARFHDMQQK